MFSAFEHFAQAKLYHFPEVWGKKRKLFQPPSSDTKHEILLDLKGIHNSRVISDCFLVISMWFILSLDTPIHEHIAIQQVKSRPIACWVVKDKAHKTNKLYTFIKKWWLFMVI